MLRRIKVGLLSRGSGCKNPPYGSNFGVPSRPGLNSPLEPPILTNSNWRGLGTINQFNAKEWRYIKIPDKAGGGLALHLYSKYFGDGLTGVDACSGSSVQPALTV